MPSFNVVIKRQVNLKPVGFTENQMRAFGIGMINEMEGRLALGRNIYDQPARPLTPRYLKSKIKKGASSFRDLRLSGQTLESLAVIEADAKHVKVGLNNSDAYKKALFSQNIEPMFGLSPANQAAILEDRVLPVFTGNVKEIEGK